MRWQFSWCHGGFKCFGRVMSCCLLWKLVHRLEVCDVMMVFIVEFGEGGIRLFVIDVQRFCGYEGRKL